MSMGGLRVLVVEDELNEEAIRRNLAQLLPGLVQFDLAVTIDEAVGYIDRIRMGPEHWYDIIFLDIQLLASTDDDSAVHLRRLTDEQEQAGVGGLGVSSATITNGGLWLWALIERRASGRSRPVTSLFSAHVEKFSLFTGPLAFANVVEFFPKVYVTGGTGTARQSDSLVQKLSSLRQLLEANDDPDLQPSVVDEIAKRCGIDAAVASSSVAQSARPMIPDASRQRLYDRLDRYRAPILTKLDTAEVWKGCHELYQRLYAKVGAATAHSSFRGLGETPLRDVDGVERGTVAEFYPDVDFAATGEADVVILPQIQRLLRSLNRPRESSVLASLFKTGAFISVTHWPYSFELDRADQELEDARFELRHSDGLSGDSQRQIGEGLDAIAAATIAYKNGSLGNTQWERAVQELADRLKGAFRPKTVASPHPDACALCFGDENLVYANTGTLQDSLKVAYDISTPFASVAKVEYRAWDPDTSADAIYWRWCACCDSGLPTGWTLDGFEKAVLSRLDSDSAGASLFNLTEICRTYFDVILTVWDNSSPRSLNLAERSNCPSPPYARCSTPAKSGIALALRFRRDYV